MVSASGYDPATVRLHLDLAVNALDAALERLAVSGLEVAYAYAPTGESLFWLISCDEGLEELSDATGSYRSRRNVDPMDRSWSESAGRVTA